MWETIASILKEIVTYVVTFILIMLLLNLFLDGHVKTAIAVIGAISISWIIIKNFKEDWIY